VKIPLKWSSKESSSPSSLTDQSMGLRITPTVLVLDVPEIDDGLRELLKETLGGKELDSCRWSFPRYRCYAFSILRALPGVTPTPEVDLFLHGNPLDLEPADPPRSLEIHRSYSKMYPYQQRASWALMTRPKGLLLSLSPGLGKSLVSIVAAEALSYKNVLIVAPLTLLRTWESEIVKWGGYLREITSIKRGSARPETGGVTLTNYDTVSRHSGLYSKHKWDLVILDESILVKTRDSKRVKELSKVTRVAKKVWCLSGSPISRHADDLWSQFHLIDPQGFKSYWRFAEQYCVIEESIWGKIVRGTKSDIDLRIEFSDIMLVVHQDEVLNLPLEKIEVIDLDLRPDQSQAYDTLLEEFYIMLEGGTELSVSSKMAQLTFLQEIASDLVNVDRQIVSSSKTDTILELLDTGYFELPTIIWTHWRQGAQCLYEELESRNYVCRYVNGDTSEEDRATILEAYKSGDIPILILSMGVGKFGLTLTNTRTMIYKDRTFDMDAYVQSFARVRRIGLDHEPTVIILRCPGTTDDLIEENLIGKSKSLAQVTNAELLSILKSLRGG